MTSPTGSTGMYPCTRSSSSSIICEEVFDEGYQPSNEEIKEYAVKIGIDPEKEPHLLYIARDGLMQALPLNWKICYNETYEAYYYFNRVTKKTQWDHPLDAEFKALVAKARNKGRKLTAEPDRSEDISLGDSGIKSLQCNEDSEAGRSIDEPPPPLKMEGGRFLTPIGGGLPRRGPNQWPPSMQQIGLNIKSGEDKLNARPLGFTSGAGAKDDKPKSGFALTGTGSMFLKSNTAKLIGEFGGKESGGDSSHSNSSNVKGILRDSSITDIRGKSTSFDLSIGDTAEDRKSVRFAFEEKKYDPDDTSVTRDEPEKSPTETATSSESDNDASDDDWNILKTKVPEPNFVTGVQLKTLEKPPFLRTFSAAASDNKPELAAKPPIAPKEKEKFSHVKPMYDESDTETWESVKINNEREQSLLLDKRIQEQKDTFTIKLKETTDNLKKEQDAQIAEVIKAEEEKLAQQKIRIERNFQTSISEMLAQTKLKLEGKKDELENQNQTEIETIKLKCKIEFEEKQREIIAEHRTAAQVLQKNHSEILEELERDLKTEEDLLKRDHQLRLAEMKEKLAHELEIERQRMRETGEDRLYEKMRCEKRLLEDKYRCLKEKYIRLKTDVKLSLERRNNRRKEQQSVTTGSETERSNSNNNRSMAMSAPIDYGRPPATPIKSHNKFKDKPQIPQPSPLAVKEFDQQMLVSSEKDNKKLSASKFFKQVHNYHDDTTSISQSDTTMSNQFPNKLRFGGAVLEVAGNLGDNGNSDSEINRAAKNMYNNNNKETPGRQRKKLFTRMKSASTSRLNSSNKREHVERPCTPVENLRRQLQKLEDLEDQFPDNSLDTTYHLRYPFSDVVSNNQKGSSELEFFKHRIHLERDSVRRAKESLRSQRTNFRARQREIKLRHKGTTRHTLDQLIQEEKELTEMEVNLHRTRALLGEKVIRLRHLEQSLQRVYEKEKPDFIMNDNRTITKDDATLSDLSSHSSSGFSSTDFGTTDTNQMNGGNRNKENQSSAYQESSEIIQSLENLNAEIREIWDILSKQSHGLTPPPTAFYPEINWGLSTFTTTTTPVTQSFIDSQSQKAIPTLADRLETYRQLATGRATATVSGILTTPAAANTIVSQSPLAAHYTTSVVERTRDLRNWLKNAKSEHESTMNNRQADL